MTEQPRSADFVQSLERGLAVIRAFDSERRELTLSDVARATGFTRATARRFLLTLSELGYVRATDGRFSLCPRVLELGYPYLSSLGLPELAPPHMERLVAQVNESSSISVLDDTDIVYVVRVPTRRIMSITLSVGTRLPAYCTSMGRVLLAGLPEHELERLLARIELRPLTPRTMTDAGALRQLLDPRPAAGIRAHRSGARGGPALDRGADPGQRRRGRGGTERVRPREPRLGRGAASQRPAAGARDGRRDRGRCPRRGT